jgi:hypothetical protein
MGCGEGCGAGGGGCWVPKLQTPNLLQLFNPLTWQGIRPNIIFLIKFSSVSASVASTVTVQRKHWGEGGLGRIKKSENNTIMLIVTRFLGLRQRCCMGVDLGRFSSGRGVDTG